MLGQAAAATCSAVQSGWLETRQQHVERDPDTIMDGYAGGDLVLAAAQVLHERPDATVRSEEIVLSPRIGRSRALSRP